MKKQTTNKKEKVVLAYSGGLDTTTLIPWLKEHFDYDVVCVCIDCGQEEELTGLDKKAKKAGAYKTYIIDIQDELCNDFIAPCLKANATYENEYLLGTSLARPAIAKHLVEIAKKENAVSICHGATGKGNDQIRFELAIKYLAPDIKVIAPWRMTDIWKMDSREDEIEYLKQKGIDLPFSSAKSSYSRDRNIWHISHEGLELEDPAKSPNYENLLVLSNTPQKAPDKETKLEIEFKEGIPVKLNGKKMKFKDIIKELNKIGGKNGIGIIDIVENRVVGIKSRGVYETPGGTILISAHKALEELVSEKFSQLVYEGKWFSPLRNALSAFIDETQKYVTGVVNLKLYKGNIIKDGTSSPYSIYNKSLASFAMGSQYDATDATGFITLFGLPDKLHGQIDRKFK